MAKKRTTNNQSCAAKKAGQVFVVEKRASGLIDSSYKWLWQQSVTISRVYFTYTHVVCVMMDTSQSLFERQPKKIQYTFLYVARERTQANPCSQTHIYEEKTENIIHAADECLWQSRTCIYVRNKQREIECYFRSSHKQSQLFARSMLTSERRLMMTNRS